MPKTLTRVKGITTESQIRSIDLILDDILKNQLPLAFKANQVAAERLQRKIDELTSLEVRLTNLCNMYEQKLQG